MELYNHQQKFLKDNPDKCLMTWDTGSGKTVAAIKWAEQKDKDAMFIVPKSIKEQWIREIRSIASTSFSQCSMVITKEEFRRDWEVLSQYNTVVADEAHYFSGMRNGKLISQMARSLFNYVKKYKVEHILLPTATPYLSTPLNIFMLARILGYDWNYQNFKFEFFEEDYIGKRIIFVPRKGIEDEIAALVQSIGDVVKLDECADVPEQVFETETFELTHKQQKAKGMVTDVNPVVRFTKYHQIENGTLKSDGYEDNKIFDYDKLDRIKGYCEQHKKVAIVCRYNLQIAHLREKLNALGREILVINGATKDKDSVVQRAEASNDCIVLINAMASEGYELPSFGLILFASMSFSFKDYKQMLGRFLRINRLKKNVYIHLITNDGVDQAVYDSIMKKQDFDVAIYAKQL